MIRDFETQFDDPTQDDQLRGFLKLDEQLGTNHTVSEQIS